MTPTPTSGAADLPEALRSIQRFEVVDCIDDKHVPAVIPKPHGPWVRYEDHIAALAAGQATAAKPAAQQGVAYAALSEPADIIAGALQISRGHAYELMREAVATDASHGQAPATQQAGATKEHVRLVRVIADKIEDGTLFRSGIYSNKDLARFVRNVADAAAPQFPTTQAQADSVQEDAALWHWLAEYLVGTRTDLDDEIVASETVNDLRKLVEAAIKQGEKQ